MIMSSLIKYTCVIFVIGFLSCKKNTTMNFDKTHSPPIAEKIAYQLKQHSDIRIEKIQK